VLDHPEQVVADGTRCREASSFDRPCSFQMMVSRYRSRKAVSMAFS